MVKLYTSLQKGGFPKDVSETTPPQVLTYKYRLRLRKLQHQEFERILEDQRQLYNAALQERIDCYVKTGKGRSCYDQCKALTKWRADDIDASKTPLRIQRWTLERLDSAYQGFFRRLKHNGKAGFPRFRSKSRWRSFGFSEFCGIRFYRKRLRFKTMCSGVRVHLHRAMPKDSKILSCVFVRDVKGWHVCFQIRVVCDASRRINNVIGIDVGLTNLATLSNGIKIPNLRHTRKYERELRRRQRALSRCQRGSKRRIKIKTRVTNLHYKVVNSRNTYLHQVSSDIVNQFDLIAVEKLNITDMTKERLGKSIHDASWGKLRLMLIYKAAKAGRRVVEVDPRNTSQICSRCGAIVKKDLSVRVHNCPECWLVLDRDHNAALNIFNKAVVGLELGNVGHQTVRSARNTSLSLNWVTTYG